MAAHNELLATGLTPPLQQGVQLVKIWLRQRQLREVGAVADGRAVQRVVVARCRGCGLHDTEGEGCTIQRVMARCYRG